MKNRILLLLCAGIIAPTALTYAQVTPIIVTNKGDKININDLKVEPWNATRSSNKATSNTQKIYQNANIGIGDYSTTEPISSIEIKGNNTAQLGFINSGDNSKFDIAKESNALTITSRNPRNARIFNLYSNGSLYLGSSLINTNTTGTGAKFVFNADNGRLSLNIGETSATQDLDIGGNARIRNLADGSNATDYPRLVVAKTDGTLGFAAKTAATVGTSNITTNREGQRVVTVDENINSTLQPVKINYNQENATMAIANAVNKDRAADGSADKTLQDAIIARVGGAPRTFGAGLGLVKGTYIVKTATFDISNVATNYDLNFYTIGGRPINGAGLIDWLRYTNTTYASGADGGPHHSCKIEFNFPRARPLNSNYDVVFSVYSSTDNPYLNINDNDFTSALLTRKTQEGFTIFLEQDTGTKQDIGIIATIYIYE